jgi:hypothetical protein
VCRVTNDIRTTQWQAAFGHSVQTIITYPNMVKTFLNRYCRTRLVNARRTQPLRSSKTPQFILCEVSYFPHYSGKAEPQCHATPVEFGSPHEAICAGFVDIYAYQFFIPTDFRASFPTCATRGASGVGTSTNPSIPNTTVNVMRP